MINISTNRHVKHMINPNYRWLTPGCYNPTPLKESRPEIQNERLLRRKEQINHQKRKEQSHQRRSLLIVGVVADKD